VATAPAPVASAAPAPAIVAAPPPVVKEPDLVRAVTAAPPRETHPELATGLSEIEKLADELHASGARKITLLGSGQSDGVTLTALTLARLLGRQAKVVLVDLSASSAALNAVSNDPAAPGLADLMRGDASFGQVITKDRMSAVHLVNAGRAGSDRALLHSPRLGLALDALLRVYDHVLLDAGTASDLPAEMLTAQAQAIVVPDPSMAEDARKTMCEQLRAVGFSAVTMLSKAEPAADAIEPGRRIAAA
jgi:Mrp family chromosome partitioning ATPase